MSFLKFLGFTLSLPCNFKKNPVKGKFTKLYKLYSNKNKSKMKKLKLKITS